MSLSVFSADPAASVVVTQDLIRIAKMRRRIWSDEDAAWLAEKMTAGLKKPNGTMKLRPVQAISLFEFASADIGGLFGPQTVGAGKTLVTLLAPTVRKATRPVLVVPAALVDKTKRDLEFYEQHWHVPHFIRILSYEWLGRAQAVDDEGNWELEKWMPDLVLLDEAHRVKNRNAAVTRRFVRFFRERKVACGTFSGTMTKRSLHEFAHLLGWCLPADLMPVPTHWRDLDLWADALDEKKDRFGSKRADPGALEALCCDEKDRRAWAQDRVAGARRVFRRRLVETPGVVATQEAAIDCSLTIRAKKIELRSEIDAAFACIRRWETPDGDIIADGLERARHARELALGFYYRWEPRPPQEWLDARRSWRSFVREVLKHSRTFDSELQVRRWAGALAKTQAEGGKLDERQQEAVLLLSNWLALRDTFKINTVPVWLDSSPCEIVTEWAKTNKGIVWVEHVCVAQRLSTEFGLTYYGERGFSARGQYIDQHDPNQSFVASIAANAEGRNLQKWSTALVTSPPPNGKTWEQMLGREHRPGQEADEVVVDMFVACAEHLDGFDQALRDARYVQDTTGAPQKLLMAAIDVPAFAGFGPRWERKEY